MWETDLDFNPGSTWQTFLNLLPPYELKLSTSNIGFIMKF